MSQIEKLGWRDERISERHRVYGSNVPATDLDFVVVEYDSAEPRALVDYKHVRVGYPDLNTASMRAMAALADRSGIPFVVARYDPSWWTYTLYPGNGIAQRHFRFGEALSERQYVAWLYRVRSQEMPSDLEALLNDFPFADVE